MLRLTVAKNDLFLKTPSEKQKTLLISIWIPSPISMLPSYNVHNNDRQGAGGFGSVSTLSVSSCRTGSTSPSIATSRLLHFIIIIIISH